MTLELGRPDGLEDEAWAAIEDCRQRLERAVAMADRLQIVGSAKELIETVARIVLDARGQPAASREGYQQVLSRAHAALDRQPGQGLAADPPVRDIARGAKLIAVQLRELRNSYGTGHGRSFVPDVAEEIVDVSVDASMLWCRWALRRLQQLIIGMPSALARDLREFRRFRSGELTDRLIAADLVNLQLDDQRLLGVAIADRAMRETFVVREDGIDACIDAEDARAWPPGYREGLAEGLFLDRQGRVDVEEWGARSTALVLAAHPDPAAVLSALLDRIREASWAPRFANDVDVQGEVVRAMREVVKVLPAGQGQHYWMEIAASLEDG